MSTNAIGNILAARVAAAQRPQIAEVPKAAAELRLPKIVPLPATVSAATHVALPIPELDQRFRAATTKARAALWEMVYYGHMLEQAQAWPGLGFDSGEAYAEHHGISAATWNNYMVLGDRLGHLSLAEMQGLRLQTMTELAKIHPSLWDEYAWIEEAKALPPRDFAMIVAERNRQAAPKPLAEPRADVRVSLPLSQQVAVARRLDQIRRKQRLHSTGDALLVAIAAVDRAGILEDTLAEVKSRVAELERLWRPDQPGLAGLVESPAERAARVDRGDTSLSDAATRTQQLARMLLKDLRDLDVPMATADATEA